MRAENGAYQKYDSRRMRPENVEQKGDLMFACFLHVKNCIVFSNRVNRIVFACVFQKSTEKMPGGNHMF